MIIGKTTKHLLQQQEEVTLLPKMACRHGLVAGQTGTGKSTTLRVLAEQFSKLKVPVFATDVKGDLSSICHPANINNKTKPQIEKLSLENFQPETFPVKFWDIFGEMGSLLQTNVAEVGHLFMSRILDLTPAQAGVCNIAFEAAKDWHINIGTLADFKAAIRHVGLRASALSLEYGHIAPASAGAIQRKVLEIQSQGADKFFGGKFDISQFLQVADGKGMINVFSAEKLIHSPRLYGAILLWLLSTLYDKLPEVGELSKPKLVVFIDEAHLLFRNVPKNVLEKVEQMIRLIRSKGVGIYLITQNPLDIPDPVLGQLGNRIQHGLRAFTPRDYNSIKKIAATFRQNPIIDAATAITELEIGEALVSLLGETGAPMEVKKVTIMPPQTRIEPLTKAERQEILRNANNTCN
jgi:uncharacterized protein